MQRYEIYQHHHSNRFELYYLNYYHIAFAINTKIKPKWCIFKGICGNFFASCKIRLILLCKTKTLHTFISALLIKTFQSVTINQTFYCYDKAIVTIAKAFVTVAKDIVTIGDPNITNAKAFVTIADITITIAKAFVTVANII